MKTVAVIQARMGSTRLPGKVLRDIAGMPMLARVVQRVRRAGTLDEVVVATTENSVDDELVVACQDLKIAHMRGSEADVLDRYYQAACVYQASVIVRITSDCPLIDPGLIDQLVDAFLDCQNNNDYMCNFLPRRTFPRGLDVEVLRYAALERAWREDHNPAWREHVTPYIYRHPQFFIVQGLMNEVDYSHMRWTVDTLEDLFLVRHIYDQFDDDAFTWHEVLGILDLHPEWSSINRHIQQKGV